MALKQTGGASLTALANVLNHVTLVGTGPWTEERVLKTLEKLRSVTRMVFDAGRRGVNPWPSTLPRGCVAQAAEFAVRVFSPPDGKSGG